MTQPVRPPFAHGGQKSASHPNPQVMPSAAAVLFSPNSLTAHSEPSRANTRPELGQRASCARAGCTEPLPAQAGPGRPRRFCSQECRRRSARASRKAKRPARPQPLTTKFSDTLRTAIQGSGLTLHGISAKLLAEDGVTVSTATLSNWQTGRAPSRSQEVTARMYALERVLGLQRGKLLLLLDGDPSVQPVVVPIQPARRSSSPKSEISDLRGLADRLGRVDGYVTTAVTEQVRIGGDRKPHLSVVRQTVLAVGDDTDCYWLFYSADDGGARTYVRPLKGCRPGRHLQRGDLVADELLFDKVLKRGESHTFTFRLDFHHRSQPSPLYRRSTGQPTVEKLDMTVMFDVQPRHVWKCVWHARGEAPVDPDPVVLVDGAAHVELTHPVPGMHGLRWTW